MSGARRGFVLPLVLWSVAILALILGVTALAVRSSQGRMLALQDKLAIETAAFSAEQEALYRVLVSPFATGGLSQDWEAVSMGGDPFEIDMPAADPASMWFADARAYRPALTPEESGLVVRLSNDSGMVNLEFLEDGQIAEMLEFAGFDATEAAQLSARLADYLDSDDVTRFRGAERLAYRNADAPEPRNGPLRTPYQSALVLGWAESGAFDYLAPYLGLRSYGMPQESLAGPEALRDLHGYDEARLRETMKARAEGLDAPIDPFAVVGSDIDDMAGGWPTPGFTITIERSDGVAVRRLHMTLATGDWVRPYRVHYAPPMLRRQPWEQPGEPEPFQDDPAKLPPFPSGAPLAPIQD